MCISHPVALADAATDGEMKMAMRSDDTSKIGVHCFEAAGLGKAPFRMVGYRVAKYQAHPDAPVQPGAGCNYCGQGIMYVCEIESADKKHFDVGCDCVRKTGDAGLIRAYKTHPEIRKANREKAAVKDRANIAAWAAIMADEASRATLSAQTIPTWDGKGREDWLTFALRAWNYCGASGRARYLREAKRRLSEAAPQAIAA